MTRLVDSLAALVLGIAVVAVTGMGFGSRAESKAAQQAASVNADETTEVSSDETSKAKIERAMSAGPLEIARSAKIVDNDAMGGITVLREGSNGFTCMPGNPDVIGDPPKCADRPAMQWAAAFAGISRSRPISFPESRTCSRARLSAVTPIPMTKPARQSRSGSTG